VVSVGLLAVRWVWCPLGLRPAGQPGEEGDSSLAAHAAFLRFSIVFRVSQHSERTRGPFPSSSLHPRCCSDTDFPHETEGRLLLFFPLSSQ